MTDEQINAAIAEACGWKPHRRSWKLSKGENGHVVDYFKTKEAAEEYLQICRKNTAGWLNEVDVFEVAAKLPNYCDDLNLMHEAERVLQNQFSIMIEEAYWRNLEWVKPHPIYATARQRAEAFLRTLGKWEEAG
jgi:hypothetical protein